jgi:hypothetical protein
MNAARALPQAGDRCLRPGSLISTDRHNASGIPMRTIRVVVDHTLFERIEYGAI